MGQRLNIEILKNGEVLANSYYHWSGVSNSAVNLTIQIINNFDYIKKYRVEEYIKNQDLLFAIRLLEETEAGVNDIKKTRKLFVFHLYYNCSLSNYFFFSLFFLFRE